MTLGSIIASQWIVVRLTLLFSSHSSPDKRVIAALQAEFDMGVLTTSDDLPYTPLGNRKGCTCYSLWKLIESRWPDLRLLRQHPDWSQLEGFYRRRKSSQSSKDVVCSGNCGFSNLAENEGAQNPSRTSWNRTHEVNRSQLRVLAVHGSRHWRSVSSMWALRSSSKATMHSWPPVKNFGRTFT